MVEEPEGFMETHISQPNQLMKSTKRINSLFSIILLQDFFEIR